MRRDRENQANSQRIAARECDLDPVRELPYGPATNHRPHSRPDRWQHPTTRPAFPRFLLHSWGRPQMSWIWCGKHLVRKSGSNLDTENNFVELIDETLNLTP